MEYLILNSGYIICWTSPSRIVLAIEVRVYKKFLQVNSTYDMYRYVVNHKKTKTTASYKKFALNYFDLIVVITRTAFPNFVLPSVSLITFLV